MSKCLVCKKETNNPKFCSKSCAAIYNNKISPKRNKKNKCKQCGTLIISNRAYCSNCWASTRVDYTQLTLADCITRAGSRNSYRSIIGAHARSVAMENLLLCECFECGYSLNVQCCHIKGIREFPLNTPVSVINSCSNLVGLCPNHHWELDHGYLKL